ncbi:uncharacterized protein BXZ73DRAFT_77026 [Epithele typhae]|uniref:uncharacterized protein n=1 Tax=Epithele typhae TaxID=378194 RepID=UPI00200854B4|nr:uncharacterized protein BXZ73DRAFT_77026 [Epithele typhae]KAH9934550.1 hypothetical protein BXZ73DRAFT_77026 [Epithele typhae]
MFPSIPVFGVPAAIAGMPFKRAQLGLYHGKTKLFGNNVPHSMHKTRRTWMPNAHKQRLFSDVMQNFIRVDVPARTLRTIKKNGGLDNYLLMTKADLLGWEGMRLRMMIMDKQAEQGVVPGTLSRPVPSKTAAAAEAGGEEARAATAVASS